MLTIVVHTNQPPSLPIVPNLIFLPFSGPSLFVPLSLSLLVSFFLVDRKGRKRGKRREGKEEDHKRRKKREKGEKKKRKENLGRLLNLVANDPWLWFFFVVLFWVLLIAKIKVIQNFFGSSIFFVDA